MSDSFIQTEGGVNDSTFIVRDQIAVISGYTDEDLERVLTRLQGVLSTGQADLRADVAQGRLTVTAPDAPRLILSSEAAHDLLPVAARRANERAYLAALLVNPRYGRWATRFVPLASTPATFERPLGWADIPLEFTLLEANGEGSGRQVRRIRLEDITQAIARHDALILLGEPGAGKTTALYKLALDAAWQRLTTGEGKLPLYLSLADYWDYASPCAFVEAVWQQRLGKENVADRLHWGEVLLLCDTLNEMPFHDGRDYRERVRAWNRFVGNWPGNQVLFTCRSRNYREPLGLHQVRIERLDDGRVQEFLGKYLAEDLARDAWERLEESPLLELVRQPYTLSLLAYTLAVGGTWPVGRARMLERVVDLLLDRERARHHPGWLGADPMRKALSALAESLQSLGEKARLPRREVLARIPEQVEGLNGQVEVSPVAVLRLGLAATLLDAELAPGGEEQVHFHHHQLQEYFAARALLARFRAGENLASHWRQPQLAHEMPDPGSLGDFEPLPSPPSTGWEEPTILAAGLASDPPEFIEAVWQANPVLAARCLKETGAGLASARLVEAVQADLLREIEAGQVHLRARIAAGDALGWLGDPRFQKVDGRQVILSPLVHVPAGSFWMGSGRLHVLWLVLRGFTLARDELPHHSLELPALLVGRFPVTNGEYGCFIVAGGYREEQYWATPGARAWLQGDVAGGEAVKEQMAVWRAIRESPDLLDQAWRTGWSPQAIATWRQLAWMKEEEVRAVLEKRYADQPRDRPAFWGDEEYNNPAQPVVGITWFEAMAYCRWLTEQLQVSGFTFQVWRDGKLETLDLEPGTCEVRLPSEAEWEKTAQMDRGWIYPWGNRWDSGRANTWERRVLQPTPVGVYPGGATLEGVHDLSGNVWEWTSSLYRPYPYRPDDGREVPETEGPRVVRGGSWSINQWDARCAFRTGGFPDDFGGDLGFRVVISPAPSSFER